MSNDIQALAGQEILASIHAGYPVLYVETWEEERLEQLLATQDGLPLWRWSSATGFLDGPGADADLTDPGAALAFVAAEGQNAICLLKDLPAQLEGNARAARALREVYDALAGQPGVLVMSHPDALIPSALSKEVHALALPLPSVAEIQGLLEAEAREHASPPEDPSAWHEACASAMKGISSNEARDLYRRLLNEGQQDLAKALATIHEVKARLLMQGSCLELVPAPAGLEQIGGLRALKQWISSRHELFGPRARAAGIEPPSGILLMGVSGCGKSLAAKTIPAAWQLPLLRLDMNLVMSGAWGSPEIAWERALRTAERAAPLVLWIDEIENSFGYSNGAVTSGNMTIFSSFLTWMQEKPKDVFVVATANKIEMLPAEMLRKGRFDQLFFLDLPKAEAREEILRIHIQRQGGDPDTLDMPKLVELVDGWTAAEIEQMVRAARLDAFYEDRDFAFDDLMRNCYRMVPLSKTMAEQINTLRGWSMKRATPAG